MSLPTPLATPLRAGLMSAGDKSRMSAGTFVVASLPTPASEGSWAYASNGRKVGEAAGSGSGVPVYYSNGSWRCFSTDNGVSS